MGLPGNQAVQCDYPKTADVADRSTSICRLVERLAAITSIRIEMSAAEYLVERTASVMVAGAVDLWDAVDCGECADAISDRGATLGRPIVSDVTADDDGVEIGNVASVDQDAVKSRDGVDTVHVCAGRGHVGVGEMQNSSQGALLSGLL